MHKRMFAALEVDESRLKKSAPSGCTVRPAKKNTCKLPGVIEYVIEGPDDVHKAINEFVRRNDVEDY